ncbi:MAG: SAM-dependent methyltransferase [Actinomadura sp.]
MGLPGFEDLSIFFLFILHRRCPHSRAGTLRTPEQIAGSFAGLDLLEPGVVSSSRWCPEITLHGEPPEVEAYCGVARKPG